LYENLIQDTAQEMCLHPLLGLIAKSGKCHTGRIARVQWKHRREAPSSGREAGIMGAFWKQSFRRLLKNKQGQLGMTLENIPCRENMVARKYSADGVFCRVFFPMGYLQDKLLAKVRSKEVESS
jgi:hypothetical protein